LAEVESLRDSAQRIGMQIEEKMKELNSLKVTPTINYWDNYKK
jgi:hypothetical protein